jgi:FtsP/CotA-like multicopper oxidase with cupredoxin domain
VVGPGSPVVDAVEAARRTGDPRVVTRRLAPQLSDVELGGRSVPAWTYGGELPGAPIRVTAGEVLRVEVDNRLPSPTTVHWHGIALRNDMDGVPDVTQDTIAAGDRFVYEFAVPDPGTYFFHSHVGLQLDRGLYAPLIVDDPNEPGRYDAEAVLVLDDWTQGVGDDPDDILGRLQSGGMGMMDGMMEGEMGAMMPSTGQPLGRDTGDVEYPLHLANGRPPEDPATIRVGTGQRLRLRLINAAAETAYRVAVGGHRMTVTHSDGFPVEPIEVDTLLLGMGERYDVVIKVSDGTFPIVADAEGKDGQTLAVLRTGGSEPVPADVRPRELDGRLLSLADLVATEEVAIPAREPDRIHEVDLGVSMGDYVWTINGQTFAEHDPLPLYRDELTRLRFRNRTPMFHPMHLHGHTFAVREPSAGARKDTVNVLPMQSLDVDFLTDNPGVWVAHCHNIYHQDSGMMTSLAYQRTD